MAGVSCESCHGGGQYYVAAYVMKDPELARLVGLSDPSEKGCRNCHDASSPSLKPFDFVSKLKAIDHWSVAKAKKLEKAPMSARVLSADFVTTATEPKGYPTSPAPEVAFVGRSNVGKSSMINKLAMRKKLVRVSHTPGRTRTLNFFDVTLAHKGGTRIVRLCDLPGYGFAKASKTDRADWQQMISQVPRDAPRSESDRHDHRRRGRARRPTT